MTGTGSSPPRALQQGDRISASTTVRCSPHAAHDLVADVTRIPEWSPECVRCEWIGPGRLKGWNRRRLGRWSTVARVVSDVPGREFSFVVEAMGGDFTQWTYTMTPGPVAGTIVLTEEFRLLVPLHWGVLMYERLFLRVADRRVDLQDNLEASLRRIRDILETPPVGAAT